MKRGLILFFLSIALVFSTGQSVFASDKSDDTNTTVISVDGVLVEDLPEVPPPITVFGAGEWDHIGTYTMSKVVRIQSGGGDLKACIPGTTKVTFGLEKAPVSLFDKERTTSGVKGDNCAVWRGISKGTYDLGLVSHYGTSFTVSIYD
ncbi:hypothetical protein ACFFIY_12220 [Bhargavaea ullalensis]|uniref:Uncharacterized protein n=1 Tax=Bhargavaea ullalensis TaxID=1265685 RepID=A0ABV2G7H4_9BACL